MGGAEQDRRAVPIVGVADPGATALAAYVGALGVKTDAQTLGLWMPLIGVLALELGAAFSVVLVRSVNGQSGPQPECPTNTADAVAHEQVAQIDNRKNGPPKRATKEKRSRRDDDQDGPPRQRGLSGLIDAVQANGGVINLSQGKLARRLGASRTTLQRALNDLAAAGAVMLDTSKAGTRLALA
jgi:uncharacterized membrane protein